MKARPLRVLCALWLLLAVVCSVPSARAADDPYRSWFTIHTPHFRVHFYKGCETIAERVADMLESLHGGMAQELSWKPREITEVVITDGTDEANGSATAVPYNTVRLFVTAPDDMSPLGDHDDWHLGLISHEYTHILHADHVTGAPALINRIIGKTFVPNQAQPRWLLEGMAILNESRRSSAGRIRSSMFEMYMRTDVLEDRIMGLDQMSNFPRRWPQGNVWYLYGSRFLWWLTETYGFDVLAAIKTETSDQLLPYAVNRYVRRSTGRTYEELYEGWVTWMRRHYGKQLAEVAQRGLREGTRLTRHGQWVARPRFVPPSARTSAGYAELLYYRSDYQDRSGFHRLTLASPSTVRDADATLVARTQGAGSASFGPDGSLVFNSAEPWRRVYSFNDLVRLPPRTTAPSGLEPQRQRLTHGMRAQDPDMSSDGRHVTFTVNHRGTTFLKIARLTPEGGLDGIRTLVPSARYEQAYTPRFSPDGSRVAYSCWSQGGYRDIRVVDVATGRFQQLMRDRAMDMQPSFSPDGRWLLFSSDRTGIPNVYAWEIATGKLWQVTNVRTGAYQPELSPDGRTLVYVGYTSDGYDLFSMPFNPASFLPALEYVEQRPHAPPNPPHNDYETRPYNPLPSLRPRRFELEYGPGTFGQALTIRTSGMDAVGHHSISGLVAIETKEAVPYLAASYGYGRLPFDYGSTVWRSLAPRRDYRVGEQEPTWLETTIGWNNYVSYSKSTSFDTQYWSLGYSIARFNGDLPVGKGIDPYSTVGYDPPRGYLGVAQIGWGYSNVESYLFGVGPRRGFSLSAYASAGDRFTASEYSVYSFAYNSTAYVPMPIVRNHTMAFHLAGAAASGDYPRRGLYYVSGFADTDLVQALRYSVFQGGYVLRGYKPLSFIGSQYHLFNFEYRFPIVAVDRGISTLPVFLQRINGNLFLDYAGSFDTLDVDNWRSQFHTGIGAELWTELQLGYSTTLNMRLGYARGFGNFAIEGGQKYIVIAMPY